MDEAIVQWWAGCGYKWTMLGGVVVGILVYGGWALVKDEKEFYRMQATCPREDCPLKRGDR